MKNLVKILFAITLCLPLTLSAQQWSGTANTTSAISRTGQVTIDNTTTVRRLHINTNTVTNHPDISLSAQAMIETESNMFLNIDSDNNTNNTSFTIGKDSPTTTGYTPLFRVHEGGNAYLYSGHYRTYGDGGLYNQTDKTYFYSDNANYFRLRSDRGLAIANRSNTRMGYLYHNDNNAFGLLDGDGNWVFRSQIDDNIGLYVDNSLKMSIMDSGNIGIGTDDPHYKLAVNGSARINKTFIGGNPGGGGFADGVTGLESLHLKAANTDNVGGNIIFFSGASEKMRLNKHGQLLINTTAAPSAYKLGVNGKIICEGMRVRLKAQWADYVFDEDYDLMSLEEVETHIKDNKHLPGVPSAKEVAETGLDIETMQVKMMEKIEELTLYIIEQDKQIKTQQTQINELMKDK